MTSDYEKKYRQDLAEIYKMREKREQDLLEERARIKALFQKRGIPEYIPGSPLERVVKIEQVVGNLYESTWFVIPEDIDLEKVVRWFVHDTKYGACTVFMEGCPYTTIADDYNIDYFFRHLKEDWRKNG